MNNTKGELLFNVWIDRFKVRAEQLAPGVWSPNALQQSAETNYEEAADDVTPEEAAETEYYYMISERND